MNVPPEIRERVARGAELLDRVKPDWFEVVTPERLDMEEAEVKDGCGCVLALNFGAYDVGKEQLGVTSGWRYGFDYGVNDATEGSVHAAYRRLDAAWLEEADRRRAAKP